MQISLQWVNELVSIKNLKLEYLIEKLTLGGFEVEEALELKFNNQKITALDISATANRSDSLSIKGISKEIAALLAKPYKNSKYLTNNFEWKNQIKNLDLKYQQSNKYSTFLALTVENLDNSNTPNWLKQKLISSGLIPLNNLLDFQAYILLETGYPIEFYDLDKIYSKSKIPKINLQLINDSNNEHFLAKNNISYKLNETISIVKVNNLSLSIAGIISHKDFSYTQETKSLLIEGAIFNSKLIRQQSRTLGLRTDRSARYEKNLKNSYLIEALYRLLSLLKISNPNLVCKLHTISQTFERNLQSIILHYKSIKEILGPVLESLSEKSKYITTNQITQYLDQLKFKFLFNEKEFSWKVQIPHSRSDDLIREIDLIEEIGRLHGFNNFLTSLPKIKRIGVEDFSYQTRKKITLCFINGGFNELIQYSLVDEDIFLKNDIKLLNPLIGDYSNLRSSLLPNLIKTVNENLKQGNLNLEGFEYGHIFTGDISSNYAENEKIAGIFGGIKTKLHWSDISKSLTWFEAKGKIDQIFKKLNLLIHWKNTFVPVYNEILHPYRMAVVYSVAGKFLGIFGQIHPILAKKQNISTELFLFEFEFEIITNELKNNKLSVYEHYSLYPKIVKDLSFIVSQNVSFEEIKNIIQCNGTKFLVQIKLLDEYQGNSIPINYKSLCIQLIFQSYETTLINKDVENIVNRIQLILVENYSITTRV